MYAYPYTLEPDDNTFLLQFPDIAIAHTVGWTEAEAIAHAGDGLTTAILAIMEDGGDVPRPSPARGRPTISLSPLDAAKVEIYRAMRAAKVSKAELARRLESHPTQVDRLLDLRHASKLEQIERALNVLGKRIDILISDKAA
ncbi:MAG TPA: type II toxin-antitoxin system HicB family antitoxin [Stellaceae bacterium]